VTVRTIPRLWHSPTGSTACCFRRIIGLACSVKYSVLRHPIAPEQRRLDPAYEIMITKMMVRAYPAPSKKEYNALFKQVVSKVACYEST
jgi:hypothetical protein